MEISDPYLKYKFIVKKWENEFIKTNSRNPKKDDIKLAEQKVRYAYKMYWKIKTSLLEKTLIGEVDDANDSTIDETLFLSYINDQTESNKPINDDPPVDINKPSVWGKHLNNKPKTEIPTIVKPIENNISVKFSKKLFDGCDFKKRNPRKSIVKKKTSELDCSQNVSECITNITSNDSNVQEDSAFHDDSNLSVIAADSNVLINSTIQISNTSSYIPQPLSILQKLNNSFEASPKMMTVNRKLDEGWLERCNENNSKITNSNITQPDLKKEIESDTDVVYESDNETQDIPLYSSQRIKAQEFSDSQNSMNQETIVDNNETSRSSKKRYNSDEEFEECSIQSKILKTHDHDSVQLSTKDRRKKVVLESKISSGKASENFVKLDMKRKIYSRGKRSVKTTTYKKKQWKNRKQELGGDFSATNRTTLLKCFKCGDIGHYSKHCNKSNDLVPLEDIGEEDSPYLTLEEAEQLALEKKEKAHCKKWARESKDQNYSIEYPPILEDISKSENISPVYQLKDNSIIDTPDEVFEALKLFGHTKFRPGQEKAIMRILSGLSTLVTLSTGSGKSLCYQLPAYLFSKKSKCITLVISPLISLMEDQVGGISAVNIACLHNSQTPKERDIIMEKLANGELSILLLSPEAVVSGFNTDWLLKLPPIAFVCLDEAHCLSQWSHNFRPSYLMICQVLREKFGVKTFLGLTATATISTVSSIASELMLDDDPNSIIKDTPLPDNLMLSVSRDKDRDKALINLLNGDRFKHCSSIIVYCIRREECERIASFIRTTFQSQHTSNGKRGQLSQIAEPYHAGLTAAKRKRTQKYFMDGQLKIVVATVAFGMGINKADLQGIIHYNMAKSLESYVQEIGRAGRDGNVAHCHLFLESEGNDIAELSRHIYSNSVDRASIRKLLERVFVECKCKEKECTKHEVVFEVEDTVSALDMKQENIQTLLCYLELNTKKLVKNLPLSYICCKITSYKGPLFLKKLSKTCPPLAVAYALKGSSEKPSNQLEFSIFKVASAIGWDSGIVKKELKNLEWSNTNGKFHKSGVAVEFSNLGFRVLAPGNMDAEQLDSTLCNLCSISQQQETKSLSELQNCFDTFMRSSTSTSIECCDEINIELCEKLKNSVREYFTVDNLSMLIQKPHEEIVLNETDETRIASDVNRIFNNYIDCKLTARAIARIFHGVESPNFPAYVWGRSPFWRIHIKTNFNAVSKIAQKQIISNLKK
ncbi:ATP-dependent DNA helicase Q4 [Acyrthosiphon pisum]|uniref:DNA 3'-5' helicase n=1 Tax=Acyrthosiphon pisum TaxID=7029 RepID=A0A8R2A2I6_ACYPI|nr:ATP-dependent DNA helicase Q4 [Acyrthosiphon pisum]|eukprot:XP_001944049.2 PREDICTED: ATP-dependent DNA helicase Q4 [Acyrthosiphon pisum]